MRYESVRFNVISIMRGWDGQIARKKTLCNTLTLTGNLNTSIRTCLVHHFFPLQLVLLFISNEFVTDDYCRKMFSFIKDTLMKKILLVMVGQGREWQESDIGVQLVHKV